MCRIDIPGLVGITLLEEPLLRRPLRVAALTRAMMALQMPQTIHIPPQRSSLHLEGSAPVPAAARAAAFPLLLLLLSPDGERPRSGALPLPLLAYLPSWASLRSVPTDVKIEKTICVNYS